MFLSEWREFPSAPCLTGKETWWQLASRCCWYRARPWNASELVSFLVGSRTYQHTGTAVPVPRVNKYDCNTISWTRALTQSDSRRLLTEATCVQCQASICVVFMVDKLARGQFCIKILGFLLSVPIHRYFQLTILCTTYATWSYQLTGSLKLKMKQAYIPLWEWLEIGISSSPKPRSGRTITCKRRQRRRNVRGTFVTSATSCEHVAVSWSKDSCTVPFSLRSFTTNLYNSASNRFRYLLY